MPGPEESFACVSCGAELPIDTPICLICGAEFEGATSPEPEPETEKTDEDWDLGVVGGETAFDMGDELGLSDEVVPVPEADMPAELGEDEFKCPTCSKPLSMGTTQCKECWTDIPEMFGCPRCAQFIPLESSSCPECFAKLQNGVLIDEPIEDVQPEEPIAPEEPVDELMPEEETEEFVEETTEVIDFDVYGIECPFCQSMANPSEDICPECGMPLIEEDEQEEKQPSIMRKREETDWYRMIAIGVVVLLLISGMLPFLLSLPRVDRDNIIIDGQFGEWNNIANNTERLNDQINPVLNIVSYKLITDAFNAYFYLEVAGEMFGDSSGNTVRIFIDSDMDESTGYRIKGTGADYNIKLFGHDGQIESAACLMFNNARNHSDINGFENNKPVDSYSDMRNPLQRINPIPYSNGAGVETRVNLTDIGSSRGNPITAVFYVSDSNGEHDFSDYPATNIGSILHVSQASAIDQSGVITGNAPVLNLTLTAIGGSVVVNDSTLPSGYTFRNLANDVISFPLTITTNVSESLTLYYNTVSAPTGSFFNYLFKPSDFTSVNSNIIVQGMGAFAYVDSAPALINIDGAFADWTGRGQVITDDPGDVRSRNQLTAYNASRLDATEFRELQENNNLNLYLDVAGAMFAGFDVPVVEDIYHDTISESTRAEPAPTSQPQNATKSTRQASPNIKPPTTYKPQLGEDAVLVFIDINNDTSDGFLVNGIGADRLLDIRGQYGKVSNVTAYEFDTSNNDQNFEEWNEITTATAIAASDGTRMEALISLSDLGIAIGDEFSVHFHVIDWNKNGDIGDELVYDTAMNTRNGVRAGPTNPVVINGIVYDVSGTIKTDATVIANYPAKDCFLGCSQDTSGNFGEYTFQVSNGDTINLYATNGTWTNNTVSATGGSTPVTKNLNLVTQAPGSAPHNFTARNYGDGPDILLNWDIATQPPGGYRVYRSNYIWGDGPRFNKTQYINATTSDWYVDSDVVEGESYYYFIASLDGGGVPTAFSPLEKIMATTSPTEPAIVYGFVKDMLGNRIPGVDVTVQNYNFTNSFISHTNTTDLNGAYLITLQPGEYRTDNSTIWCNATLGGMEGQNTTTIPEWCPEWGYYSDRTDSAVCNITVYTPNITVNKTVDLAEASPGQALTYTIWINNTDTWDASIVWVNDTLPNEFIYTSDNSLAVSPGWSSSPRIHNSWGQVHNWTFFNVTPGNHAFDIDGFINSTTPDNTTMINWVFCNHTALGDGTISIPGNPTNDSATTLVVVSNITVEKIVNLAQAYPGQLLTYTIYFNNTGGTNAVYMWINDTLPTEVTYIDHTAVDPLETTSEPYFQNFNRVGQNLYFEFANVPPFPLGLHQFDIIVRVNSWVSNNTIATNWVFCNYTTEFTKAPESIANASTIIVRPDIIINKTVDFSEALPGDYLNYTITFTNYNATASRVWINDTLPGWPGLISYDSDTANLVTGATFDYRIVAGNPVQYRFSNVLRGPHSFDIMVRILDSTPFCTWLNNTVSCDFAPAGYTTFDNASTHVIRPVINIVKIVNQTFAAPGETVIYTIFFNNTDDTANATNVWITDTLPYQVTYVSDTSATSPTSASYYASSGASGQQLWFNFTNVEPGVHYFNITVQLIGNLTEGEWFRNWAYIEYSQANGLKYGPYSDYADIIVIGGPLIIVQKTVHPKNIVNTGDKIFYRIRYNNNGNGNASYVWINDTLPIGIAYNSDTSGQIPTNIGNTYRWVFRDVAPGSHLFIVNVTVTNDTDGTLMRNWVFCNYTTMTGVHGPESKASADVTLNRPVITVQKYVDKAVASPGSLLNYTIWYNNTGSYNADVWINDTIPSGTTYLATSSSFGMSDITNGLRLTWYMGLIAPGIHFGWIILQINATTNSGTILYNTVELNYTCPSSGYEFAGSSADATTIVSAMVIEKTVDMAYANPGDYLNYTIYFNNTANFTILYAWINDTLPDGVSYVTDTAASSLGIYYGSSGASGQYLFFNFTNLPQGFYSFVVTARISPALADTWWLNNTAYLDYTDNLGNTLPSSNDTAETMVNRPIIEIAKTVDKLIAAPGDGITYSILIWNNGSINASHAWVNETFPTWLQGIGWSMNPPTLSYTLSISGAYSYSWHIIDLPTGLTTITITATINPTTPDDTNITNYVTCEYEMDNGVGWNTSAEATTWVVCAKIVVQKSVDKTIAYPGQSLTYTIWFNNTGHGNAAHIWINDTLPAGVMYSSDTAGAYLMSKDTTGNPLLFRFGNVPPGVHSFTITVAINTNLTNGTNLTNWAVCEYVLENGLGWQSEDWATTIIVRPVIVVQKTVNLAEANPGDYLVYTIYFNNTGGGMADNVRISDEFPPWVLFTGMHTANLVVGATFTAPYGFSGRYLYFNFTNVQPGAHSFTITVLVDSSTQDCPKLVNNVTCMYGLSSGLTFETTFDNATTHINRPTITVTKDVDYSVASPGFYLNYTITFTNWDSGIAPFVWINDTLPDGVIFVTDTANLISWFTAPTGQSGQRLYFNFTNVPGFSTFSFQITVWITDTGHSPGDELWNWVWLNYTAENGYPMAESSDSVVTIISDIAIVKTVNQSNAGPGDWLQYTIYFNNTGSTNAAYVWINDTLPSGVTWQNDTAFQTPGFSGFWNDGTIWYYNFTNIAPGDYSFVINVTVDPVDPGTVLENWAFLNYTNAAGVKLFESWDNAITIVDRATIIIEKMVNQTIAEPGDFLLYTIWFNNTGQIPADNVWINDTLPSGVTYISDTNLTEGGVRTGNYNWTFTNVAPGNHFFTITVRVNDNTPNGTVLMNTVTCNYETGGYQYAGSSDWAATIVYTPIITVKKVVDITEATIGDVLTYTIYFNNTGWADAYVNITDILDPDLEFDLSSSGDYGNHNFIWLAVSGQTIWLEFTNVAPGVHYVYFSVNVSATVAECNWLTNTVFLNYSNSNGVEFEPSNYIVSTHILVPNITVDKDVNRYIASPGDYLTYTITFTNVNIGTAGWVNITDTLPIGVVYISDTSGICERSGQYLWFNFTNVPTGTYSFDIRVYINPSVINGTLLVNNVLLNYTSTTGLDLPGDEDDATTLVAILAVVKVVSQGVVKVGDTIIYTIYFNNTGNFTIPYVWINDTLPGGVNYISDTAPAPIGSSSATLAGAWNNSVTWYYNFTNVQPGSHWFTITVQVTDTNAPGTLLSNMVQLNYTDAQGFEMTGSIDWAYSTVAEPVLNIIKNVNLNDASPGDQLVYTITLTNMGTDATGMIWVNDTLPSWLSYVSDTTGTLSMPPFVDKWINGNKLHFNFTGIGPGVSVSFNIRVLVNTGTPDLTIITNWAFANYTSPSGYDMGEIFDNATTTIRRPIINVDKTVNLAEANPGDTLIYTIWYNNIGSGTAGDLWINDTLPSEVQYQSDTSGLPLGPHIWVGQFHSWHFTNVLPGNYFFTITVTIDTSVPNCRWFNNSVFWGYTSANHITPVDVVQTESNDATTHVIAPVIDIDKTVVLPVASPGDTLTYTIYFNNTGVDSAFRVWINDTLPSGVTYVWDNANVFNWTAGLTRYYTFTNVAPGVHSFNIIVLINADVFDSSILNNTVTCDYMVDNGYRFPRTSAWAETLVMRPIGTFAKTASTYYVSPNEIFNYTVYFNNSGSGNAASVWIVDILPVNVTYVSDNSSYLGGTFWQSGRNLYFNFTNVPTGDYWFNVSVQVNTDITDAWILATNWAFCNYSTDAGLVIGPLNNSADVVIRRPIITVEKIVNLATAGYNEMLIYTIWFNNTGADIASFVWINDTLSPDVTYVSDTNATEGGIWTGYWNWTFTNVAPGVHSFIIVVTVNPGASSPVINNVTLNYTASNDYPLEGSWDEVSTVITAMAVVKVATDYVVTVGQQYNYTIWFNNTGGSNANFVWINDTLPSWVTYVNDSAWQHSNFAGTWNNSGVYYFNFTNVAPGVHWLNITVQVNFVAPNTELWNTAQLNYTDNTGAPQPGSLVNVLTIVAGPIIDIVKTVDMSVAYPNDYLNYTIYINNTGTANATYVWVNDTLPAGVIHILDNATDVSGYFWTSYIGNYWQFEFENLTPGNHWFWILVRIDPGTQHNTVLNNTVECFYNVSIYGWSCEDYALTRVIRPVIDVDKIVDKTIAAPYDILTYAIWFNNIGSTAQYVWINDTLPSGLAGVTYISDTNSSCPGVSSRQYMGIINGARVWLFTGVQPGLHFFTISVRVNTTVIDGDTLRNDVKCEFKIPNGFTWNTTASAETTIRMPQFQIVKVVDKTYAYPTEILTYTIWYNNTGSLTSPWVRIEDTMPIGVTYRGVSGAPIPWQSGNVLRWDFYNVAPGNHFFTLRVTINANVDDWTPLTNNIWCNFTLPNGYTLSDGSSDAWTIVIRPVIDIDKTVDKSIANPGDYLYYTIYYNNTGNGTARYVWVNDTLPAGVSGFISLGALPYYQVGRDIRWRFDNVGPGNYSLSFRVRISNSVMNGTWLTNWAFCNYTGPIQSGYLKFEETRDRADTLVSLPNIKVVKIANIATVNPGGVIIYTIYYNNTGGGNAFEVIIIDILPDWVSYYSDSLTGITPSIFGNSYIWNIGTVSPGPHSFTITVNVSTSLNLHDGEILINEVTCEYGVNTDTGWVAYPSSIDWANVTVTRPDIELVKSVNFDVAYPYDVLVYTIQFNNIGSDNAAFLWINDTLSIWGIYINDTAWNVSGAVFAGKWNVGNVWYFNFTDVVPGNHSFTILVRVNTSVLDGVIMTNLATCDYKAQSNLSFSMESNYAITLIRRPIIVIQKSVNQTNANPGDSLLYTIYFNNTGSGIATHLWINDTLPYGVTYVSDTNGTGILTINGNTYSWYFTNVTPGLHSFNITVTIDLNVSAYSLLNTATCEYKARNGFDYGQSNDTAFTQLAQPEGPVVTTTPPAYVFAGDDFILTAYVTDDVGITGVVIYYTDIEGNMFFGNMTPIIANFETGMGWYSFRITAQMWKGIVTYFVWVIDTDGLTNRTGYFDVRIILPPYFVWGNVYTAKNMNANNAMVIVCNYATNETVVTKADSAGYYLVDLGKLASGYLDGQELMVFAIDSELFWYGYSYGTIDINSYNTDPPVGGRQLPSHISGVEADGHPYQRINISLIEIPEFSLILVPIMISLTIFVVFKRKKNKRFDIEDN
ncbi:MAG: DUF11 domain-containing protein [Candidatus Thermoplasmatota archaeon]|nr:DUF11 domain-containing protein [Candidatus Thermoplasmatota archaeon]